MPTFTVHHISRDSHHSSSSGTAYEIDAPSFSTLDITSIPSTSPDEKPPSEPAEPWPVPNNSPDNVASSLTNVLDTQFSANQRISSDSASVYSNRDPANSLRSSISQDTFHTTFGPNSSTHQLNDPNIPEVPPLSPGFRLPPPTVPVYSFASCNGSFPTSPNWTTYPLPHPSHTLRHTGPSITNAHPRSCLSTLATRAVTPCPSRYDLSDIDAQMARRYVRCFEQISEGDTVSLRSRFSSLFTQSLVALSDRGDERTTEAGENYDADGEEDADDDDDDDDGGGGVCLPPEEDAMKVIRRPRRTSLMETLRKTKRRISRGYYSDNVMEECGNRLSYTPGDDRAGVVVRKRSDETEKDVHMAIEKKRKLSEIGGSIKRRVVSWRRKFSWNKDAANLNGYDDYEDE